jgi:hypothetical protein
VTPVALVGSAVALATAFDPQVRRILEIQEAVQRQDDEDGDPLRPRVIASDREEHE